MQCVYPARRASRDLTVSPDTLIDHLEHVSVDRLAKKEALERRRTNRREQLRTFGFEAPFERVEFGERIVHGDVSPKLVFKRRDGEPLYEKDVHVLTVTQVEPYEFYGRVRRHGEAAVLECPLEERRRLLDFARGQCQMGKSHFQGSRLTA